nr:hypothetical protein [Actinocrinis puniceicyclus]
MSPVDLELRAQRGDRAAQFVCGVGDESALPVGGRLDPTEQVVEGAGQPVQFIGPWRGRQSAVQVGAREQRRLAA